MPPHFRAYVTFQDQNGSSKEWRGWYTGEDTEDSIERKARSTLGILGSWRRFSYWRVTNLTDNENREEGQLPYPRCEQPRIPSHGQTVLVRHDQGSTAGEN
jgi:hypothetical protein